MEVNFSVLLTLLFSILLFSAAIVVRIGIVKYLGRKRSQRASPSLPNVSTQSNNVQQTSVTTEQVPSDYQIVFARMNIQPPTPPLRNIRRWNTDIPATEIIQEIEDQRRLDNLQIEYEGRAEERREALNRQVDALHMSPLFFQNINNNDQRTQYFTPNAPEESPGTPQFNICNFTSLPRYVSQDDELPSYEQAIATNTSSV